MLTIRRPMLALITAAGVLASAIPTAAANPGAQTRSPAAVCQTGDVWSAADLRQAWIPADGPSLGGSTAYNRGDSVTFSGGSVPRRESGAYLLRAQLRLAAGAALTASGQGVIRDLNWQSTQVVSLPAGRYVDPVDGTVEAHLFVQGDELSATVERRVCGARPRLVRVRQETVSLPLTHPRTNIGWVGVGLSPHVVVQPWSRPVISIPG